MKPIKYTVHLNDEAPRVGSGRREVLVTVRTSGVTLQSISTGSKQRVSLETWKVIADSAKTTCHGEADDATLKRAEANRKKHAQDKPAGDGSTKSKGKGKTKRATKAGAATKRAQPSAPKGEKGQEVARLIKRKSGASMDEIVAATGWLPHTARAFIATTMRKGMGLTVKKIEGSYQVLDEAEPTKDAA